MGGKLVHESVMAETKGKTSSLWLWLGITLGAGILYVLSVGPAVRLCERKVLPGTVITTFYRPLRILDGTPFQHLLQVYMRFWAPPPREVDFPTSAPREF